VLSLFSQPSLADEGGVSFWIPGFFGSLAAAPMVPGFSLASMYYHTSVTSDSDVARAKEITIGRIPATIAGRVTASLKRMPTSRSLFRNTHSQPRCWAVS
jgi:hypothetical protein